MATASCMDDAWLTATAVPTNAASTSLADSPIATTARSLAAWAPSPPRSRSLFRPPAISTTWSSPRSAALGRVGVRGLGVVDVAHARDLADQLHPVRERRAPREHGIDRVGCPRPRPPPRSRRVRSTRRVILRRPSPRPRDRAQGTRAPSRRDRRRRRPGSRRASGARDPRLGRHVVLERAVPVEMVGGDASMIATRGRNRSRRRELERRHLGDDDVDVVGDGLDRADGRCCPPRPHAGPTLRASGDQRGDRRLAVGAGDRDDRRCAARSAARSISLRIGTPRACAATIAAWSARTSGLGTTRSAARDAARDRAGGRAPRRARRRGRAARRRRARVRGRFAAASLRGRSRPNLRRAAAVDSATPVSARPDDEGARHSSPPRDVRKSA